jgi:hypothetical protein
MSLQSSDAVVFVMVIFLQKAAIAKGKMMGRLDKQNKK